MKILGWMHRKFRQNSSETQKDFSMGFAGLDELQCYQKGNYGSKTLSKAPREYRRNSFTCSSLEVSRVEEELEEEEEEENALTELFHGFLAIGTLGTEQYTTDPATPAFSISVDDDMAEKEKENERQVVTENQLKLINHELEKVLGADDEMSIASSGRNSHCSTITLNGEVCPLQTYLFGSAVGNGMQQQSHVKKQHRTSLGELFHKTKQADEYGAGGTYKFQNTNEEKERHNKSMKKLLKKILFIQASDSTPAETKLHKMVHNIFNRKVHPENGWQADKPKKDYEIKSKNPPHSHSVYIDGLRPSAEDIIIYPHQQAPISKQNKLTKTSADTTGNWVKTDADYLVLEL